MWMNVLATLAALAAFLTGLRVMREGLAAMGGGRLTILLKRLAMTPTRGIITGAAATALVQSSAAITAIAVGFVASGSMAFRDALGVVLGSNVGSTITPQLLTLNLWSMAVPCFVVGAAAIVSGRQRWRNPGLALTGFATIFISLQALSLALHPLALSTLFRSQLETAGQHPIVAAVVGCAATALIQSSTATTVITMALARESLVPISGAIAIVLGANVGTCLTSVIAALGQSRAAQQVALSHVLLNIGGVVLFLPFLEPYADAMGWLANDPAQQIANAHTLFNVICTALVWPFTARFASLVERLLPDNSRT